MTNEPVFIALDFENERLAWQFLEQFGTQRPAVKVGMELFYVAGPAFIRALKTAGYVVFLDLKMYDIPNTVGKATQNIAGLGVDYLTVHAAGGERMMRAAALGARNGQKVNQSPLKILAITQLTSFSNAEMQATQLISVPLSESVLHLAKLAEKSGLAGVISSAHESRAIHQVTRADFLSVTPGIRFIDDDQGDQQRITTPAKAKQLGADGLVIGRSITGAKDPVVAYYRALQNYHEGDES
ncbi:orotidine-5'-phosphate decarboxylase [Weissella diestrammenae]|uniref:Orotidine 5'-phosphate decarboxylase n=1 Tax=Weissella diestrammenae TaxID=1162633 RepID=A0A7G9T423_9LACO|nr:orotidine-5'-phosphate decarboxylase [Weissella diestrammenae]MCM0583047.1 orotidine-5'-phosphate decarboxylase [Weissella diestrammenae]QNN74848.1 orotidine-5'-phosphate decarboxylase [Weissella diestrammenae]